MLFLFLNYQIPQITKITNESKRFYMRFRFMVPGALHRLCEVSDQDKISNQKFKNEF